jgi:hypothetical protein
MVSDVRLTRYFPQKFENGVFRDVVQPLPKRSLRSKRHIISWNKRKYNYIHARPLEKYGLTSVDIQEIHKC